MAYSGINAGIGSVFWKQKELLENRCQNIHFGLAIYAVIPVSVHVSKMIYSTYQESIDATIDEANDLADKSEASKDEDKDSKKR